LANRAETLVHHYRVRADRLLSPFAGRNVSGRGGERDTTDHSSVVAVGQKAITRNQAVERKNLLIAETTARDPSFA